MMLTEQQRRRVTYLVHGAWDGEAGGEEAEFDAEEFDRRFAEVLGQAEAPEELHLYAVHHNWDDGVEKLRMVIDHPLCDAGTALVAFWLGEPAALYHRAQAGELEDDEREVYGFLKEVESRYVSGRFGSRRIRVDPRNMLGCDWVEVSPGETGAELIPDEMKRASPGQEIEEHDF